MNINTTIGNLKLSNPFIAASGTYGYGIEWEGLSVPSEFGAIVAKGIFLNPKKGNPHPRIAETSSGLINSIGLEGPGIDLFIDQIVPMMLDLNVPCIANINGENYHEYGTLAERLDKVDAITALEVNVSCPNLETGGMAFGVDPVSVGEITRIVREKYNRPVIVKLTPNVTDIRITGKAALDNGADILSVANTYTGMAIDVHTRTSRIGRDYGGYSGPGIKPITLKMVHDIYKEFKCPVIGSGGVYNLFDCLEYFIAGAGAIMLGTVNFIDPTRVIKLKSELSDFLDKQKTSLDDLIGSYRSPST
jgi:dihydroorotate dehydrogenase (NAD+) catalytic subunit